MAFGCQRSHLGVGRGRQRTVSSSKCPDVTAEQGHAPWAAPKVKAGRASVDKAQEAVAKPPGDSLGRAGEEQRERPGAHRRVPCRVPRQHCKAQEFVLAAQPRVD